MMMMMIRSFPVPPRHHTAVSRHSRHSPAVSQQRLARDRGGLVSNRPRFGVDHRCFIDGS